MLPCLLSGHWIRHTDIVWSGTAVGVRISNPATVSPGTIDDSLKMNLQKLNEAVSQYKNFLQANPNYNPYWKWESQRVFKENWDIDSRNFYDMFDACLQNSQTRRLWNREHYAPKDMMLKFIRTSEEYVRFAFQDLFNENKEIEGRVDRFVFYCDELLREYREKYPTKKENTHYHNDNYEIISHYLAFRFPDIYTPYHFETFKNLMLLLGSRDVPKVNDTARYFKVMRTIFNFIKKEEGLLAVHQQRLDEEIHFMGETLLIVDDFCKITIM